MTKLTARYGIKQVVISAYHPQANGMVKRGHKPIMDALAKMEGGNLGSKWVDNLHAVLWADQLTVKTSTGMSLFWMVCGQEPVLPIDLEIPTWRILPWDRIETTADLLAIRGRQLQRWDTDIEEAAHHLQRMRQQGQELFDDTHRLRTDELKAGDLVLLFDSERKKNMSSDVKLTPRWNGPY